MRYASRKFIGWIIILAISTVAMFASDSLGNHVMSDVVWVSVNLPAFGVFCGFNVWQKKVGREI